MDWSANIGWILLVAFGIGALHALEPGHGKSIMGAYLVASRGGVQHAFLLGLVVTITHTLIVFLLAFGALALAGRFATAQVTWWLEITSGVLVLGVGLWMVLTTFDLVKRSRAPQPHGHGHGPDHALPHTHGHQHGSDHVHPHPHEHGHNHGHDHHGHTHEVQIPEGKNPLSMGALVAVGASGGLVPCPAALAALLAAVNLGRPLSGIAVVAAMSLGIASTLIAIGIAFVQAGRWASSMFDTRGLSVYIPRVSAILISILGGALLMRSLLGHGH